MKLAYFPGCKISFYLKDYGISFEALMENLGVQLVKLPFNCCGYPERSKNFEVSILSSIKNYALAQQYDLDIITPCKCCFGQFKHASYWYDQNKELKEKIDNILDRENLFWDGKTQITHLLSFLHDDFGIRELEKRIKRKLPGKNIAVQYGCHALRPFAITGFDNPYAPKIFEELLNITGVKTVEWPKSTECCGNPIFETNPRLSLKILQNKIKTAKDAGADYICTACSHCQMQYEMVKDQEQINSPGTILFTQVLGAALGINGNRLSTTGRLPSSFM
ncbi:MAG: disulfide reductase [Desulfobacteraceae bacterium]|nr:disulfide reductase [Desulfobacteraceae bacterium]